MFRQTRIVLPVLFVAAVACGVAAVLLHSEIAAIASAVLVTLSGVVAYLASRGARFTGASARASRRYATSTSTVDVVRVAAPAPVAPDTAAGCGPGHVPSATPPLQALEVAVADTEILPFTPKLPPGSEPADVVTSLLVAARAAGRPLCAHLWLEDAATGTLRLVEAQGPCSPEPIPVNTKFGLLGDPLGDGLAHLGVIGRPGTDGAGIGMWRYVLPLDGVDLRGVAAVDFEDDAPEMAILTTISATLRASLAGALALHVARAEAETARILVETCAALGKVLDPNDVLHTALDSAMKLSDSQTGSIMILDPETHRMRIAVSRGLPEDVVTDTDISEGDGIAGWVVTSRQPLVIEDLKDNGIRSRRHGVRSAVCVPLFDDQGVIGVLNVGATAFHARFSRTTLKTLEALGRTVVVALRNAWASDEAQDLYFDTLKALSLALEARDPYSRGETQRVVDLVDALGEYFGLPTEEAKALRVAAMLHDVGMSAAGTAVFEAHADLTTMEWGMLKMHPVIAAEILAQAPALKNVIPIVYHHHEHYDGTGYVAGLSGYDIPLGARILSVVDAYVAMTSGRPYRVALTPAEAVSELRRQSGAQFDPAIVVAAIEIIAQTESNGALGS